MGITIDTQRLERTNKGFNFLNLNNEYGKKKYFISVLLKTEQNLKGKEEKLVVDTNLPFCERGWRYSGYELTAFLKEFEEFVKLRLGKIIMPNKTQVGNYELSSLKSNLRNENINIEDIEISIGVLAEKKLKELNINFAEKVRETLNLQDRKKDKETQNKVNKYILLREKIITLKNLLRGGESHSGYGYNRQTDNSLKITLTAEEYNSKLKEVEIELRALEKEFNLREERVEYVEIKEPITYEKWLEANREVLEQNFEEDDNREMTFDEYAEMMFEESEGENLGENEEEFDEEE